MHESDESAEDKAFFSRRLNQVRPKDAQSSKKIYKRICYFYDPNGKTGHVEERCWFKHGRPTRSHYALKNADAALSQHNTEWPLDYGFSLHITSYLSSICGSEKRVCRLQSFPTYVRSTMDILNFQHRYLKEVIL